MRVLVDDRREQHVVAPRRPERATRTRRRRVLLVAGAAGSRTRPTGTADFAAVECSTHHFIDLNVFADHLLLRANDQDGEQFR